MEVDERPTEQYSDIGGLDKQIQEVLFALKHLYRAAVQWLRIGHKTVWKCTQDWFF